MILDIGDEVVIESEERPPILLIISGLYRRSLYQIRDYEKEKEEISELDILDRLTFRQDFKSYGPGDTIFNFEELDRPSYVYAVENKSALAYIDISKANSIISRIEKQLQT